MHVLMIGGDQATSAAVTDALSRHRVTPVRTVEEGLVALAGGDVDLVVLDLAPPGGLATLARIRGSRHGTVPVAVLSERASELDHVQGLRAGADAYVVKPFDRAELAREVEDLLLATSAERQARRSAALSRAELLRQVELRFARESGPSPIPPVAPIPPLPRVPPVPPPPGDG